MQPLVLMLAAAVTRGTGALGGLGGGVLLVPVLVLTGTEPGRAAPLGLLTVAAGSISAGARQLLDRSVNHRLGVLTETAASTGAVVGALVTGAVPDELLRAVLAAAAVTAAVAGGRRSGLRNPPDPRCEPSDIGERVGSLEGAYPVAGGIAPYRPRRVGLGTTLTGLAGLVAGLSGTSGAYIKTPVLSEIMHVPTRVAAATMTFTSGVTASAALCVHLAAGRVDPHTGSAVIVGGLVGGAVGARLQGTLDPTLIRRVLSVALVAVAVVLVAT